ncbi:hypothetical protein B0H13DRAFT_2664236 [Mycena leptocephala]|nr:hypothetical protein B0H13DRAFT_2664236 [Mycena leptocephala]
MVPRTLTALTQPCFSRLSHLHLHGGSDRDWGAWFGLASLPRLTHLSFDRDAAPMAVWSWALIKFPFLEVLVVLCNTGSAIKIPAPYGSVGADPRFVHLPVVDYFADWECGARGGEDYWARADAVVNPGEGLRLNVRDFSGAGLVPEHNRTRGDTADLDEAVEMHREAVALRPPPHPERPSLLSLWFDQQGDSETIDGAIQLHHEALDLRPLPHPFRPMSLNNLANSI